MGRKRTRSGLTDECLILSVEAMARDGVFKKGPGNVWSSTWKNDKGEITSSISYFALLDSQNQLVLQFKYDWTDDSTGARLPTEYPVGVTTTPILYGGSRHWFVCPLAVGGVPCQRRVGRLYLPAGGRYFGCRICYNLTYRSQREHDKRFKELRKLPEDELLHCLWVAMKPVTLIMRAIDNPSKKRSKSLGEQNKRRDAFELSDKLDELTRNMGLKGRAKEAYIDNLHKRIICRVSERFMKEHPFKPTPRL